MDCTLLQHAETHDTDSLIRDHGKEPLACERKQGIACLVRPGFLYRRISNQRVLGLQVHPGLFPISVKSRMIIPEGLIESRIRASSGRVVFMLPPILFFFLNQSRKEWGH